MVEKKVCHKIRDMTPELIRTAIDKLKDELRTLRNAKSASGSASKLAKIKIVRQNIARHLTILNQKIRQETKKKFHHNSIRTAQFLRKKLTRAFRRELTKPQLTKKIRKVQKREQNFPLRNYGLKP